MTSRNPYEIALPPPLLYERYQKDWLEGRVSTDSATTSDASDLVQSFDEKTDISLGHQPQNWLWDRSSRHLWLIPLIATISVLFLLSVFSLAHSRLAATNSFIFQQHLPAITLDHIYNGSFVSRLAYYNWIPQARGAVHATLEDDWSIVLHDLHTNQSRRVVDGRQVINEQGLQIFHHAFSFSSDMKWLLVATDHRKLWRHSSYSNFYLHSIDSGSTYPITSHREISHTSIARFSPRGTAVAFVHDNDLFFIASADSIGDKAAVRITDSGSATNFNGIPDWVIEEELLSSDSAIWWNPDGSKLAFMVCNETQVPTYSIPIYNPNLFAPGGLPYPENSTIRYPKPGYANPDSAVKVFDLTTFEDLQIAQTDLSQLDNAKAATVDLFFPNGFAEALYSEVVWITAEKLIVKESNRIQTILRTWLFDFNRRESADHLEGQLIREVDYFELDGGWVEPTQNIRPLLDTHDISSPATNDRGYLDVLPDDKGFRHVAYYSSSETRIPMFLTSGEWEVDGGILAIEYGIGIIYFIAALPPTQRRLISLQIPDLRSAVDITTKLFGGDTYATASFSPDARFYLYTSNGPAVPTQKLVEVGTGHIRDLADNQQLREMLQTVDVPTRILSEVTMDGYNVSVLEIRPSTWSGSNAHKYPVFVKVYGGPNSQTADQRFSISFDDVMASEMDLVVLLVDGRGTGFKGRQHRCVVQGQLGKLEAEDVIAVARQYAALDWVDETRIAIWGWSYGGYLTTKVLEAGSSVFSLGIAVAPVVDWRMYDSIYTERYMGLPSENRAAYDMAMVSNVSAFHDFDFLLMAGSGDDNVHFDNEAMLIDRLTIEKVRRFRLRLFIDSDHRINTRSANRELYEEFKSFVSEKWHLEELARSKQASLQQHW